MKIIWENNLKKKGSKRYFSLEIFKIKIALI